MLRSDELIGLVRKKNFLAEEQVSIARLRVHVLDCLSCWEDPRQLLKGWARLPRCDNYIPLPLAVVVDYRNTIGSRIRYKTRMVSCTWHQNPLHNSVSVVLATPVTGWPRVPSRV